MKALLIFVAFIIGFARAEDPECVFCNAKLPPCPSNCKSCTYTKKTCDSCPTAVCVGACVDCPPASPQCGSDCLECAVTPQTCEVCPFATCLYYLEPIEWALNANFAVKDSAVRMINNQFQWQHILSKTALMRNNPNSLKGFSFSPDRKTPYPAYIMGFITGGTMISSPSPSLLDDASTTSRLSSATSSLFLEVNAKSRQRPTLLDKINVPGFQGVAVISNSLMLLDRGEVLKMEVLSPSAKKILIWINALDQLEVYADKQKLFTTRSKVQWPLNAVFGAATRGIIINNVVWENAPF